MVNIAGAFTIQSPYKVDQL